MNMTFSHVLDTLNRIVSEIKKNDLSIFAGAGLSVASGFVDWKKLLKRFSDILDIEIGSDLSIIAQYFEEKYNRQYMCESIIKEFNSLHNSSDNINLDIIASLPVDSFWTTNYDSLIEDKLYSLGRRYQKIVDQSQFKNRKPLTEVRVYKMHGDKDMPDDVVITKSDYDTYDEKRWFFTQALLYELVTKTFLFIGFSFTDPNLDRILRIIKNNFRGISPKNHYCFMKSINRDDYDNDDTFKNNLNLQSLKIDYMTKLGINTILVDEFSQITFMLEYIRERIKIDNIFISGAKYGTEKDMEYNFNKDEYEFMISLSHDLIFKGYNIYTGFGKGVGNYIVSGAISAINQTDINLIDDRLNVHPMINANGVMNDKEKKILRERMIGASRHVICLYGHLDPNKGYSDAEKESDGVYSEYSIAKRFGKNIIVLPHTKNTAELIYNELEADDANKCFDGVTNPNKIIDLVMNLLDKESKKLENDLYSKLKYEDNTNIFISFHYNDNLDQANKLKELINNIDSYSVINIENEKIDEKDKIYNWIEDKLSEADVTILLIDNNSLSSEYVKHEILKSIELGKSFVTIFIDEDANNPLIEETYTGEKNSLYGLFPTCLFKDIKSEDDVFNLVDQAKKIGSILRLIKSKNKVQKE